MIITQQTANALLTKKISERLKRAIQRARIENKRKDWKDRFSISRMCADIGYSKSSLIKVMRGEQLPELSTLYIIANYLGVNYRQLID